VLLEVLLVFQQYLCKYLIVRDVEARGVEPLPKAKLRPASSGKALAKRGEYAVMEMPYMRRMLLGEKVEAPGIAVGTH
jgi:hypothetical protein